MAQIRREKPKEQEKKPGEFKFNPPKNLDVSTLIEELDEIIVELDEDDEEDWERGETCGCF